MFAINAQWGKKRLIRKYPKNTVHDACAKFVLLRPLYCLLVTQIKQEINICFYPLAFYQKNLIDMQYTLARVKEHKYLFHFVK